MIESYDFAQLPPEKSDLAKLKREVLDLGPEAALPHNLPDVWLSLLDRDLEMFLLEQVMDSCYLTAPLAIVAHILLGKKGGEISFSMTELFKFMQDLRTEISLEIVRRCMGIASEPATLDTIFSNRQFS